MFRPLSALIAASVVLALPTASLADKPNHAKKHGNKHQSAQKHRGDDHRRVSRSGRDPVVVVPYDPGRRVVYRDGGHCPPGLAKKHNGCMPPGQAKKYYRVGDQLDWNYAHRVSRPDLYGLGPLPRGQRYAIVGNRVMRVDSSTAKILAVMNLVETVLD